jgi:hypothetical protein
VRPRSAACTALAVALLAAALLPPPDAQASTIIRSGGGSVFQLIVSALAIECGKFHHDVAVTVIGGGSGAGIAGAAAGTLDIGLSSRDPLPSDPAGLKFIAVAREGFAIIVNPRNPITSLTHAQNQSHSDRSNDHLERARLGSGGTNPRLLAHSRIRLLRQLQAILHGQPRVQPQRPADSVSRHHEG